MSGAVASGALSVLDALPAALRADADLLAWLGGVAAPPVDPELTDEENEAAAGLATRVFTSYAPDVTLEDEDGVPTPYITCVVPRSGAFNTFAAPGAATAAEVRVWVPRTLDRLALEGAVHVGRIFRVRLTLTGHRCLVCAVEDVLVQPDPDRTATQALTQLRVHTEPTS